MSKVYGQTVTLILRYAGHVLAGRREYTLQKTEKTCCRILVAKLQAKSNLEHKEENINVTLRLNFRICHVDSFCSITRQ
jgi:hypothetical protein